MALRSCVDLVAGFPFKSERFSDDAESGTPLVKGENVSQGRILWSISRYWPAAEYDDYSRFHLLEADVVVAMDRPWVPAGLKWAFIRTRDPKALLVQRCARMRSSSPLLIQNFLRFLIGGPDFSKYVQTITTGVNVPHISGADILAYEFPVPPVHEQARIANILSAYDDLIENSERRIRVLDEMTRSLYHEWFVNFRYSGHEEVPLVDSSLGPVPKGWEIGRLDDLLVLQRGFDLPRGERRDGNVPVVAATGPAGFHDTVKVRAPGVVTGRSGSIGDVMYIQDDFWPLNTSLWVKDFPKSEPLFAYFLLSSIDLRAFNSGAAVPTLNRNDIHGLPIVIPPRAIQRRFQEIGEYLFDAKRAIEKATQTLRATRDLLLPRLLSGQFSVADLAA